MENSLSIRSYTRQRRGHTHTYHQLVLPIQGTINIELSGYTGKVSVGECVVIQAGQQHYFKADEAARFIVADLNELPANLTINGYAVFCVTPPLLSFLFFIEKQLEYQVDDRLEQSVLAIFYQLLEQQGFTHPVDPRIRSAQSYITERLCEPLEINLLAGVACLSPTQFKKLFKKHIGISAHQYITQQRMEKAKALLSHTDLPVQLVAEQVGYRDLSAFSRRFSRYFGLSPREFVHQSPQ